MREILGKAKTVRELLKGVKYSIDYYQREYKWHEKQIRELVDDLSDKFLEEYQSTHPRSKVADYPHYFLGSIIISKKDSVGYIVDGQQRHGGKDDRAVARGTPAAVGGTGTAG